MPTNKKKLFILLAVIVLLAIIIIIVVASGPKKNTSSNNQASEDPTVAQQSGPTPEEIKAEIALKAAGEVNPVLKDAKVTVPGASLVSKDNLVITPEGKPTENNVTPMTPTAPKQTPPITAPSKLTADVIKLNISTTNGYSPKEFSVNSDEPATIAVTGTDSFTHIFMFDNASLSAVAIGIGPNETRAITFNAPKAGTYTFRCDVPGHAARGEVGKMLVK